MGTERLRVRATDWARQIKIHQAAYWRKKTTQLRRWVFDSGDLEDRGEKASEEKVDIKANKFPVWILFLGSALILIVVFLTVPYSQNAKEKFSHYEAVATQYADEEKFKSAFWKVHKICKGHKGENHNAACDRALGMISGDLAANDLAAQRSMAASTKGILQATYDLLILSAVSTAFLLITVATSIWVLIEARKTTSAAQETLEAAKSAERPRVVPDFRTSELCASHNEHYQFGVRLVNLGDTPAIHVKWFVSAKKWGGDMTVEKLPGCKSKSTGMVFGEPMLGTGGGSPDDLVYLPLENHGLSVLDMPKKGQTFYILWFYTDTILNRRMRGQVVVNLKPSPVPGAGAELKEALKLYRQDRSGWDSDKIRALITSRVRGISTSFDEFKVESIGPAVDYDTME